MKNRLVLIYMLLFGLLIVGNVMAVSFTVTTDISSASAGQASQLVNFTVQNTGAVNITQVNVTLPPGSTFTGVSNSTTTAPYTTSSSSPSWINSSAAGLVANGATQYFWIYINTPSTTGSYSFNVSTLDASRAFSSNNVSLSIYDTTAPTYSSNTTSPSNGTNYVVNQTYWFNVTWGDNGVISKVWIYHNFNSSQNITMNSDSSVYYIKFNDLAANTYWWQVFANDTNNTVNSTVNTTFLVNRTTNDISVYLNGSLNSNITSINNSAVNVTASAACTQPACTITILRDGGTLISGGPNPSSKSDDIITSVGLHNYTVSVASNANYSSNSVTYFVATVPSYSTPTNLLLTYSNSTAGSINITFSNNASLANVTIQGDWSGTARNYSMTNTTGTSYFYNITFPAGSFTWKIYGIYSNHSFLLSGPNTFTINKATATIRLSIVPEWTLDSPVQTNASCTIDVPSLTVKLYRNGTTASNPDVQTFSAGAINVYICNNTADQNYTVNSVENTSRIKRTPTANLTFSQAPTLIELAQNSNVSSGINVKNTGGVAQDVTFDISGLDKGWYSISQPSLKLFAGVTNTFAVSFNVGNVDVKDYKGKFTVTGTNGTISQDFTLRILPSSETKLKINDTLSLYKLDVSKLETQLNEIKDKINNTAAIEQKMTELRSAVSQAETYINSSNYFQAQQTFETIKTLISDVQNQLKAGGQPSPGVTVKIPSKVWVIILVVVILFVVGILAFLFWPVKGGYKPDTGYEYAGEKKGGLFDSFKNFLSKFKRKKKTETVFQG